jgi:hypothetical protein
MKIFKYFQLVITHSACKILQKLVLDNLSFYLFDAFGNDLDFEIQKQFFYLKKSILTKIIENKI